MMHKFMELNDGTVIVYSDVLYTDGAEMVKVYMEKPVMLGFKSAYCYLPSYEWEEIVDFTPAELDYLQELIKSTAHLIIQFARQGGIGNAANF